MNTDMTANQMAQMLLTRPADAHKGTMGHALLVSGSKGISGCAVLGAEACLRSGCGKLTVDTPEENRLILQVSVPEAIVAVNSVHCMQTFQAIGIGPGIGTDQTEMLRTYLQAAPKSIILDADALHMMAECQDMMPLVCGRAIFTPHPGEMVHLVEGLALKGDRLLTCAQDMAQLYNVIVVLKGHPTHICFPNGNTASCPRGNAGMATAGSGDVLTGIITGLLAQGYLPERAALMGVWLHATAGDYASMEVGEECLIARDIISHMPQAFNRLHEIKDIS